MIEIKKTIPFTVATKTITDLGINPPKETKDLYAENYKTLMKEIKDKGFPSGSVIKNPPANGGDPTSILGLGTFHMRWSN